LDFLNLGKKLLFISLALVTGLFIGLHMLEAHAPDPAIDDPAAPMPYSIPGQGDRSPWQLLMDRLDSLTCKPPGMITQVASSEFRAAMISGVRRGRPFARLWDEDLFLIDARGRVLSNLDSAAPCDLPVISGTEFEVDLKRRQLTGDNAVQTLTLLHKIRDMTPGLAARLSEVQVVEDLGLVVHLDWKAAVPLVFGHGKWERKIKALDAFVIQFESSDLLARSQYIDFRLDGQIIVKRKI